MRIRTTVAHVTLGAALSASLAIAVTLLLEEMEERFLHATMLESLDLLVQIGRRQEQPELAGTKSLIEPRWKGAAIGFQPMEGGGVLRLALPFSSAPRGLRQLERYGPHWLTCRAWYVIRTRFPGAEWTSSGPVENLHGQA